MPPTIPEALRETFDLIREAHEQPAYGPSIMRVLFPVVRSMPTQAERITAREVEQQCELHHE